MSRLVASHWDAASCVPAAVPAVVCFVDSTLERKLMLVVFFTFVEDDLRVHRSTQYAVYLQILQSLRADQHYPHHGILCTVQRCRHEYIDIGVLRQLASHSHANLQTQKPARVAL